jgi:hypothetical protein
MVNYETLSIRVMNHALQNGWEFVTECCTEPEIERSLKQHGIQSFQDALRHVSGWGKRGR